MSRSHFSFRQIELLHVLIIGLQLFSQPLCTAQTYWRQFHVHQQRGTGHRLHSIAVLQSTIGKYQAAHGFLWMSPLPRL